MIHRYQARFPEAEADLRQALEICRQLGERSLVAWTASELVRVLLLEGDDAGARRTFEESTPILVTDEPGTRLTASFTEILLALADGDRERAANIGRSALDASVGEWRNVLASRVWWIGQLVGSDAVGGDAVMDDARATLEAAQWIASIREPDQYVALFAGVA